MTGPADRLVAALEDRYRIERELGAGGMATVYLAADLKHDRKVAIKVLKPELAAVLGAERFVQEIKTTAALSHPHILPLFDSGEAGGFLYYVMPYLQGETIREKLNREAQFGIDEAVKITTEVAEALDYAHQHGVIHRDIKPENILLHAGRPMVMDFGIALAVSAAAGGRMTETGLSLGTPHYMSPEQATAEKEITARSDVYSLGSVLYEMLAGVPPHEGGSAQQVIMRIIADTARPVTELRKSVPPNVAAAVAKALEKLPADRFAGAKEFGAALADRGFVGNASHVIATGSVRVAGMGRMVMLAAAAAVLLAGAALGYVLRPARPAADSVVRFQITLPADRQIAVERPGGGAVALSPDGKWVALVVRETRFGLRRLYLRRLDRLEMTLVEGTDGAFAPFFSPDSRSLGFIAADGRLRRLEVEGGPITTISDRPAGVGSEPTWADDGQIYFRGTDYGLYRVSATGGTAQVLGDTALTIQLQFGRLPAVYSFPAALPGGRRILVSECVAGILRGNGDCSGRLVIMDVASGEVTPLDVQAARGWYVQGHLVLLTSDGSLSAVEFDAASGTVRGDPVTLLDGLGSALLVLPRISVAASGALLYLQGTEVVDQVIVETDRRGAERVVVSTPGPYAWIRLSPDGTRIAMIRQPLGERSQLFVFDKRTGTTSPLTFEGANQRPSWSPDSRWIAFSSASTRDSVTGVWIVPADGSAPARPVAKGKDVQQHTATSWTPDGRWIIIDGLADDGPNAGQDDIYALAVGGDSALRPIVATLANEQTGEVSPDGRWIAYVSDDAGEPQIYVQPFRRPGGRSLVSLGPAIEPAWASANELIYSSLASDSLVSARLTFGESITITRTPLLERMRYGIGITSWREYDVARDGQRFIFTRAVRAPRPATPVVVVNWMAEVRAAIAARRAGK